MIRNLTLFFISLLCLQAGAESPSEQLMRPNFNINEDIEPTLDNNDRTLYQQVAPLLKNNPQAAISQVEAGTGRQPNAAFSFLLGSLYYEVQQYSQSEYYLKRAIEQKPNFLRAYRSLGLVQIREGRYREAAQTFSKVIALGGGDAQSYGLLAHAYLMEEKYQSALSAYQMARMFEPDRIDFQRGSAQALYQTGYYKQAITLLDELINAEPGNRDYWLLQSNAYLALDQLDDAAANLEIVQGIGQASASSLFLLGDLYLRLNNHSAALTAYLAALSEQYDVEPERAIRPLNYLVSRQLNEEASHYLNAIRERFSGTLSKGEQQELSMAEASIAVSEDDLAKAQSILTELVTVDPLNGPALLMLGDVLRREESYAKAAFYLERAAGIDGTRVDALVAQARVSLSQGKLKEALSFLRKARQLDATRTDIHRYIEALESRQG